MEAFTHQTARLSAGRHAGPEEGVCVMELASLLVGEPFTDRPRSVSANLSALLRGYNDGLDDARRQTLKRFAAASVGTATGRAAESRRRRRLRTWLRDEGRGQGLRALLSLLSSGADPYAAARTIGARVVTEDDDALHARMLGLLDEIAGTGRSDAPAFDPGLLLAGSETAREAGAPAAGP